MSKLCRWSWHSGDSSKRLSLRARSLCVTNRHTASAASTDSVFESAYANVEQAFTQADKLPITLPEGVHGRYFINPVARTLITRILFMKCCALYTEILRRQGPYIKSWMPSSYVDDMCQLTCGWLPYCLQIKRHYGRFQEGATRAFFVTRFETATWKLSNVQVLRISMKDADALSKNCHS